MSVFRLIIFLAAGQEGNERGSFVGISRGGRVLAGVRMLQHSGQHRHMKKERWGVAWCGQAVEGRGERGRRRQGGEAQLTCPAAAVPKTGEQVWCGGVGAGVGWQGRKE